MDFFDNMIDKTKELYGVAKKKTGEVVNTEKLKYEQTSLQNKQEKDYSALGRICFEQFKNDENASDEIKALVSAIKEKDRRIAELGAEIFAAKNKAYCTKCGAAVEKNSVFCSNCGEKMSENGEQ